MKRLLLALSPVALLAACGEEPADDSRSASGEVLEGTISDAMLPVDTVRSEPPLADPEAARAVQEGAADGEAAVEGEEGEGEPAEGEASEEPAAEATPEVEG